MSFYRKKPEIVLAICITAVAAIYRYFALGAHPFWVDEFSSAAQAMLMLERGTGSLFDQTTYFEYHNITTHLLIALSFIIFGASEWSARLPIAVVASILPVIVFLFAKQLTKHVWIALCAALFCATSYILITWSVQARGYALQQIITTLTLFTYIPIRLNGAVTKKSVLYLCLFSVLGIITHISFVILIGIIAADMLWTRRKQGLILQYVLGLGLFFFALFSTPGLRLALQQSVESGAFLANNLWYYHSFLWREFGLTTFLAVIGYVVIWQKYPAGRILVLFVCAHLFFYSFVYRPYTSRYLLLITPYTYLATSIALFTIAGVIVKKKYHHWGLIALTLFIIGNGDQFSPKPKKYYSVNHTFREVALVDYNQVYQPIQQRIKNSSKPIALIDTWWDRARWYVGANYKPLYGLRWENESGLINGLSKKTPYIRDAQSNKVIYKSRGVKLVSNQQDLLKVIKTYPQGYLFVDDESVSKEIVDYANKNFKKEIYVDHYPLDDNPYSIWPATLYSWGMD